MRLRSTGAASACARPARCGDSSGGILLFLHRREIPRRAAGPEEVGPAALRARFRQRRGGGECRCCVGGGGAHVSVWGGGALPGGGGGRWGGWLPRAPPPPGGPRLPAG